MGGGNFPVEDATEAPVRNLRHGPGTTSSGQGALAKPSGSAPAPAQPVEMGEDFMRLYEPVSGPIPRSSVWPSSRNGGKPIDVRNAPGPTLRKLMHLQPDKLDLSFVEKVIIPEAEILDLCNDILPASEARKKIDFARLNNCSANVVGLYGSKKVMVDIFRRLNFGSIASLLTENGSTSIDPGVYGFLDSQTLYVFYWHQGSRLQEASRKEVSCNFIRYLADLCGTVCVCLDSEDLGARLITNAESRADSRKKRTKRIQVSVVKQSENDINLKDGFHICPAVLRSSDWVTKIYSDAGQWPVRFVSGLHRCGIMTLSIIPPRQVYCHQQQEVKEQDLSVRIEEWRKTYDIDVVQLPEEEFVQFLRSAKLEGYQSYKELLNSFEEQRAAHKEGSNHIDELLKQENQKVVRVFTSAVRAYFGKTHAWEEAQMNVDAPFAFIDALVCPCDNPEAEVSGAAEEAADDASGAPPPDLHTAAMELGQTWACSASDRQEDRGGISLIFPNAEVTIVAENEERFMSTNFILKRTSSSKAGPLLYKEELTAIATNVPSLYEQERTGIVTKPGNEVKYTMTCSAMDGECPEGPLLTSRFVRIQFKSGNRIRNRTEHGVYKLVCDTAPADGMFAWINSYATTVPRLKESVQDLAFLIGSDEARSSGVSEKVLSLVSKALNSRDIRSEFQKKLSREPLRVFLASFKAGPDSPGAKLGAISKLDMNEKNKLSQLCRKVYAEARSEVESSITQMVKKKIDPMLLEKLQFERQKNSASLEKSFDESKTLFLSNLKQQLSCGKKHGRALAVTRWFQQNQWYLESFLREAVWKIHYCSLETESTRVMLEMAELNPMKKDLDAFLLKDTHVITPECSTACMLIEMDPSSESIFHILPVKSGEVLLFVKCNDASIHLYVIPRLGVRASKPVMIFKRGSDLVALDETARLLSFYDQKMNKISVFHFDDTFRHFTWSGVDLALSEYAGVKSLTSMMFVPGKREMVLIDSACKVRIFEISQPGMLRPRHILLASPDHEVCVSSEGSCLLVIYRTADRLETSHHPVDGVPGMMDRANGPDCTEPGTESFLEMEVYLLDETLAHLKTIKLEYSVQSIEHLDVGTVSFGSQAHIVLLDRSRPERGVWSKVVQISSASEVCHLQAVKKKRELVPSTVENSQSCPALDYMHLIFEKYATSPPLMRRARKLKVQLVLGEGPDVQRSEFQKRSISYIKSAIDRLEQDKGKDFSQLELSFFSECVESCFLKGFLLDSREEAVTVKLGDWMRLLVCLVPIQIARAENNSLRPMIDGLQMPATLSYANATGLAAELRFGFYDAVLAQWSGPIKVISSMGKQSSGKSYLLNHLTGSLFDVAGGRCTDGVWLTMRACMVKECLYVVLDFEGLGSFERSEQEDMLLSILNAAIGNITIFNKKDFHLDKETEAVFERFQNGVSLVKADSRLFKGLFYMAIKDVDTSDVEDLKAEFESKIKQICIKSQYNFLTEMYGGEVEIAAMAPFHRPEYHDGVEEIAEVVDDQQTIHQSGSTLAVDLKLVIAQISVRDWSSIDRKRIVLKLDQIRKHLKTAINLGRLMSPTDNMLVSFETLQEVPDLPIIVGGYEFDLSDTDLELSPSHESRAVGDIVQILKRHFESSHKRFGPDHNDQSWHSVFEKFLVKLAERRKNRILEWLKCNTSDFQDDEDVQKLRRETVATLDELTQRFSLCRSKCKDCFFGCVLEESHPSGSAHNCQGTHACNETCSFCAAENVDGLEILECGDASGHAGLHDCRARSHTCGENCIFLEESSNCNGNCALKPRHEGEHRCNTKQHLCNKKCSSSGCKNSCVIPLDAGEHEHICHESMCPMKCAMPGCARKCASDKHFHSRTSQQHFCENEHVCKEMCQAPGICEVHTERVSNTTLETFKGMRSTFEYEVVSEQNGNRKQCCIPIPPGKERHDGEHCHTLNANAVHFCTTKCAACGYFCNRPIDHQGLHDTTHGNMRNVRFVAEAEDIDIMDRKYFWGESGKAEMCMLHCKAQGRGHIHLIKCLKAQQPSGPCAQGLLEGARHETREYGPDKDVPKDELSHAAYWKHMRFKDPCLKDDQKQFEMCNHHCRSADHVPAVGSSKSAEQERSYCTEKLWHAPVARTGLVSSSSGYVTEDGHHFSCDHLTGDASHIVFIIDTSGSMSRTDVSPSLAKFCTSHKNRLGCVYEAILRFIRTRMATGQPDVVSVVLFHVKGSIAVEMQLIAEQIVDGLLQYFPRGDTTYSSGLFKAQEILQRASQHASMQDRHPAVIFLSDGENNGGSDPIACINKMKDIDDRLVFHTILFRRDCKDQEILKRMATAGNGSYQVSIDEVQLARSFEGLAKSLRPKVAALM